MTKATDTILKLFKKFRKEELVEVLCECGILKDRSLEASGSRLCFINRVLRCCTEITPRQVALIDLMYHQAHSESKKWKVFQLSPVIIHHTTGVVADPAKFEARLRKALNVFFRTELCLQVWNGAYWIRLCILEKTLSRASSSLNNTVFLVYKPLSKYVLATAIKAAHKSFILQALINVIDCHDIEEVNLSGRNVHSLTDMLLNSTSQGVFSNLRLNETDPNPLVVSRKRKRKLETKNQETVCEHLSNCCENENKKEDEKRNNFINETFGSNKQPVLEKIEFKLETRFRGAGGGLQYNGPLHCRVKFEGPSVIEGLKELATLGLADVPMPPYLANISSLSRNHFLLTDKKRARIDSSETAKEP